MQLPLQYNHEVAIKVSILSCMAGVLSVRIVPLTSPEPKKLRVFFSLVHAPVLQSLFIQLLKSLFSFTGYYDYTQFCLLE